MFHFEWHEAEWLEGEIGISPLVFAGCEAELTNCSNSTKMQVAEIARGRM
jgi:hypothetical protein